MYSSHGRCKPISVLDKAQAMKQQENNYCINPERDGGQCLASGSGSLTPEDGA
jgi:hypothetical protein